MAVCTEEDQLFLDFVPPVTLFEQAGHPVGDQVQTEQDQVRTRPKNRGEDARGGRRRKRGNPWRGGTDEQLMLRRGGGSGRCGV